MHARGVTATVIVAAAIGMLVGAMGPWEADWAIGRTRKPAAKVISAFVRADRPLAPTRVFTTRGQYRKHSRVCSLVT